MADVAVSTLAALDLEHIYLFSALKFGEAQADRYTRDLYERFKLLADFPGIGAPALLSTVPCLKFPSGSHVIFYRRTPTGVFVGRVLHGAQDAKRYVFPASD